MTTLLESICYLTKEVIKGDVSNYFIVCSVDHVSNCLIVGASLSEPHINVKFVRFVCLSVCLVLSVRS